MPRRSTGSSSTKPTGSTKNSSRGFGNPLFATLKGLAVLLMLLSACITWKLISSEQQHANNGGSMIPRELCTSTTTSTTGSMSKLGSGDDMCQKEYQRVTNNRTKGITRDDLERSRALVGNRYRLAMLAKTLKERKRPITGVVCGGSISLGHGVVPKTMRYSDRLQVWFDDYYPLNNKQNGEKHIVYNRGSHGADMCAMAKRVNVMTKELPADPDLFVLEFAVNDYQGQDHKIHLDHKTDVFFEGFDRLVLCAEIVVHQLLSHYPNAAVLFLELQTAILNRKTAALLHMGVAKHYQVPVISYAETFFPDFYRLMDKLKQHDQYSTATTIHNDNGKSVADPVLPYPHGCIPSCLDQFIDPPFRSKGCKSLCVFAFRSGQRDLKCDDPLPAGREPCYVSFLAHDAVHLSAVGHQMAADLIAEAVASTARDICQFGQDLYPEQILPTVGLMVGDPKVLAEKSNFVLVKDCMEIFAKKDPLMAKTHSEGFKLYGDSVDRPGWIATNPSGGETVTFPIDLPEKRCYAIHLAILKSYEKMGTFTVTVKDLKTNQETTKTGVDGLWKPQISVPNDMQITEDDSPACTGKCTVEITTDPQIPGRTGNKVKIVTLSARECVTP